MAFSLDELKNKNAEQRANIKARELGKLRPFPRRSFGGFSLELQSVKKIDFGVEVLIRAWDSFGQLGFGKRGKVDIERIRIINPPLLVDSSDGDIEILGSDSRRGSTENRKLKLDPEQALLEALVRVVSIHGKRGARIKKGFIGNTITTAYSDSGGDGECYEGGNPNWSTIRDALSGNEEGGSSTASAYSEDSGDVWIARFFLPFNTSSVPDDEDITEAYINLRGTDKELDDDDAEAYMAIVESTEADPTSLDDDDYPLVGETALSNTIDISDYDDSGFNTFTLNAGGIALISKTGYSKFALREGHDLEDVPIQGNAGINLVTNRTANYSGTSSDPIITITSEEGATYQISGQVTLNGSPVGGAVLRCVRQSDNVAIDYETTDSNGDYIFSDLEEEELYHIAVEYSADSELYNSVSLWDIEPVEVA